MRIRRGGSRKFRRKKRGYKSRRAKTYRVKVRRGGRRL